MARIERILGERRSIRPLWSPESALGPEIENLRDRLGAERRRAGKASGAWDAVAPDDLKELAHVVGLVRGVLTVRCRDASAQYEVDRWLRTEGQDLLLAAAKAPVRRIKLVN